jgi:tripartite-type tricarboxylate transporter receptor subunit TctC
MPFAERGELKVVAISSADRIKTAPEVPTLREKGIDFVRFGWLGICAAEGTPEPILARLNKELRAVVAMPDYQKLIEQNGSIAEASTPLQLRKIIDQTRDETAAAVQAFGLQRD